MRIVIAPDSFKESLSARDVARAIADGLREVTPQAQITCVPMADGGEGSLEAVLDGAQAQRCTTEVLDANERPREASWAWLGDGRAFIEMAAAAGLEHIPAPERRPLTASTYGVGQLIKDALDAGARHIVLGLGGSATNDAGAGVMQALGVQLLDKNDQAIGPGGGALLNLARIDMENIDPRFAECEFQLAVDVDNPLCGPRGASAIFGPQKGASPDDVALLDRALAHFADICAQTLQRDNRSLPGMGAAGGLGFAIMACASAHFRPGVDLIADITGLDTALQGADLVFTGEGRMDAQTLLGKTPVGVARYAARRSIPVIALAGSLGPGYEEVYKAGITAAFSVAPGPISLEDACSSAYQLLRQRAADCMRLWLSGRQGSLEIVHQGSH